MRKRGDFSNLKFFKTQSFRPTVRRRLVHVVYDHVFKKAFTGAIMHSNGAEIKGLLRKLWETNLSESKEKFEFRAKNGPAGNWECILSICYLETNR